MTTSDPTIGRPSTPKVGRAPKFSIEEIIQTSLDCARENGLDSITMRSVATALGSSPMTLYRYVEGRDELLAATADGVLANLELPVEPTIKTLRPWLIQAVGLTRTCLLQYPGTADHFLTNGPTGPNGFALMATICKALGLTGREPEEIAGAYDWLMTTLSVYISKEERMNKMGGGASTAKNFRRRFQMAGSDAEYLGPIVASFTGDMELSSKRATNAVINSIIDSATPPL